MLTFQELGGSPVERYSESGFTATRQFLVPWEHRNEFAISIFGSDGGLNYPGRNDVFASKLRFEPFDTSAVRICELEDLKTDAINYNGSFAKAIVDYQPQDTTDRDVGPVTEEGTSITYRMIIDSMETVIPATGWTWSGTSILLPEDTPLIKRIPITTHYVTWGKVLNPPWETISAYQGTLNNAPFLGCATGTLLFEGVEANKLYRKGVGLDEGPSNYVWALKYTLREKAVKFGGNVYGWNDVYRSNSGTWSCVKFDTKTLYDYCDFNALFLSDALKIEVE